MLRHGRIVAVHRLARQAQLAEIPRDVWQLIDALLGTADRAALRATCRRARLLTRWHAHVFVPSGLINVPLRLDPYPIVCFGEVRITRDVLAALFAMGTVCAIHMDRCTVAAPGIVAAVLGRVPLESGNAMAGRINLRSCSGGVHSLARCLSDNVRVSSIDMLQHFIGYTGTIRFYEYDVKTYTPTDWIIPAVIEGTYIFLIALLQMRVVLREFRFVEKYIPDINAVRTAICLYLYHHELTITGPRACLYKLHLMCTYREIDDATCTITFARAK